MNSRDLYRGATVYHTLMVHWGKGTVIQKTTTVVQAGRMGYREVDCWEVEWEGLRGRKNGPKVKCRARELRKTPNTAKIKRMEEIRAQRKPKGDRSN